MLPILYLLLLLCGSVRTGLLMDAILGKGGAQEQPARNVPRADPAGTLVPSVFGRIPRGTAQRGRGLVKRREER